MASVTQLRRRGRLLRRGLLTRRDLPALLAPGTHPTTPREARGYSAPMDVIARTRLPEFQIFYKIFASVFPRTRSNRNSDSTGASRPDHARTSHDLFSTRALFLLYVPACWRGLAGRSGLGALRLGLNS